MLNIIKNTINRVFASGVDSDASAFITATGLSGTTQKSAITTLVKDLKSSGLWSKMKAVYPMVTDNVNTSSYTEDFSNAYWSKYFSTITANSIVAPNGTLTADTLNEDNSNNAHSFYSNLNTLANTQYTSSIYVKAGTRRYVQLATTPNANDWATCVFDTTDAIFTKTQVSGNVTATFASTAEANGWYRISITWTCTISGVASPLTVALVNVPSPTFSAYAGYSYTGNGSNVYVWGAQTQLGGLTQYQSIATTPSAFMASQMKYNLKDARDLDAAFRLTWSGGWTYSATGATPNGTNAYADTKMTPSVLPQNDNSFGFYSRTNIIAAQTDMGTNTTYNIGANFTAVGAFARNNGTSYGGFANADSLGFYYDSRIVSTQHKVYKNGNTLGTVTNTSSAPDSSIRVAIGGEMLSGNVSAASYSTKQFAFVFLGNGLTDSEAQLFNQIVEKYQVALSRGVQAAQSFYYNSAYSNEANTYLYSTQITGTTQVSAINTLINGLKANNLWTKMKAVYPFVTDKINLIGYTEDFANAYWGTLNATITSNTTLAPNGTLTADTFTRTSSIGYVYTATPLTLNADKYTISVYAKANTNSTFRLDLVSSGLTQGVVCTFDLSNGTASTPTLYGTANNFTAAISDDGNGWYRCSLTGNLNTSTAYYSEITLTTGGSIFIWGNQVELGNLSTYQPVLAANNYATNVAAQMKFNLVNPQDSDAAFRLAFSGGWTYSTNGAQPNGTNGYADTKLVPSGTTAQNSLHISAYLRTDITQNSVVIGGYDGVVETSLYPRFTGNIIYSAINSNTSASAGASSSSLGNFIASRLISTQENTYIGNTKLTRTQLSLNNLTRSIFIGALNYLGGANVYSSRQTSFATIGDGLNDTEAALLYQLVQQFQTDLSRQV